MFSANASLPNPSQDFIALCQSQVMLLAKTLQADWSGVYLTSEEEGQPVNLIPVMIYPLQETTQKSSHNQIQLREEKEEVTLDNLSKSLPTDLSRSLIIPENDGFDSKDYQIVLPLVYQEVVLGVLVTRRDAYPWKPEEFHQVEQIADTLAIARLLDQRQGWYQEQLKEQQLEQQKERDRLDDLFHQLRNPLTALKVFGKLLLKRLGKDEQNLAIINNIVREGEHLQELIKEFESHQKTIVDQAQTITLNTDSVTIPAQSHLSLPPSQSLELTLVYLQDILDTVVMSAESIAENKGINLNIKMSDDLDPVLGNYSALREVFSNLIDNSIKYTPISGEVKIKLGLSKIINNKKYQGILIEDTGYGIPIEDQAHIFERHYRGIREDSDISGSGLGLAIAKELVTQMGGLIELSSPINLENNTGTRFVIWLVSN
ncbi:GAF domain-containing sensor histidine kinase [Crocosphaera chwakensis]|uniref:GAF domain-containing sensor histidine kinase n=1 Tax=Crocosphaera chwakensis TaxID=2546361 RepID=UPI00030FC8FA|nr:GAF domain-containing sensor histidine kinase [Crocosphaera chwakensis]